MCLETSCDLQTAAGGHDVVVVVPELALGEEPVVVDVCAFEQHARVRQLHHVEDFLGRDADAPLGVLVRVVDESALNLRLLGVHLRFGNTSIGRKLSKFTIICLILYAISLTWAISAGLKIDFPELSLDWRWRLLVNWRLAPVR